MLGYLLYRGAIRINLTKFFTWTGAFLILVAAGVLSYGIHDLQEAGFLPGLNNIAFDVSDTIDPTTWYATVLKGVLNFSPVTTKLEAARVGAVRRPDDGPLPAQRPPPPSSTPAAAARARAHRLTHRPPKEPSIRCDRPCSSPPSLAVPALAACTENAPSGGGGGDDRRRGHRGR